MAAHYTGDSARLGVPECLMSRAAGYAEGVAWSLNILGPSPRKRATDRRVCARRVSHPSDPATWRMASVLEAQGGVKCRAHT
jgi:hypothetical protein